MDNLMGIARQDWFRLLLDNKFAIDAAYWTRAVKLSLRAQINSSYKKKEDKKWGQEIKRTKIEKDPIFILGHWRSGTTLLHNYLTLDPRFAYPTLFQVSNPHTFLILEPLLKKSLEKLNDKKRPMDNVKINYASPGEEAFAIAMMSLISPLIGWSFPRNAAFYDRYLTFEDVEQEEFEKWRHAFELYIKKLTFHHKKQLVLKSPSNTAIVQHLVRMYPNAKFIHIHRNPYKVFSSTLTLYKTAVPLSYLQHPNQNLEDRVIKQYDLLYRSFLNGKEKLSEQNFIEIGYDELVKNPMATIQSIYQHLHLGDFESARPLLEQKVIEAANYKRNHHAGLAPKVIEKINSRWGKYFREWGYALRDANDETLTKTGGRDGAESFTATAESFRKAS